MRCLSLGGVVCVTTSSWQTCRGVLMVSVTGLTARTSANVGSLFSMLYPAMAPPAVTTTAPSTVPTSKDLSMSFSSLLGTQAGALKLAQFRILLLLHRLQCKLPATIPGPA